MKTDPITPANSSSLFRPRIGAVSARAAMAGVLGVLAAAPSARAGVTMPTLWTENGHSYQVVVVPDGIVWSDARDAAAASGGHLVGRRAGGPAAVDRRRNRFRLEISGGRPTSTGGLAVGSRLRQV